MAGPFTEKLKNDLFCCPTQLNGGGALGSKDANREIMLRALSISTAGCLYKPGLKEGPAAGTMRAFPHSARAAPHSTFTFP